jgi:DNA invertase Pin-like site-specific DNA recombinase
VSHSLCVVRSDTVTMVAELDRVAGRSAISSAPLDELYDLGIAVVSVEEGFDSTAPQGRLLRAPLNWPRSVERRPIHGRWLTPDVSSVDR